MMDIAKRMTERMTKTERDQSFPDSPRHREYLKTYQTRFQSSLVNRQGPIPHSLQHMPAAPMLQGTMASARLKAVVRPMSSA